MKKVLVVDDERILTDVLVRFLKKLNCHPTVTETGVQALEAYSIDHFDLVLMDVNLADCDGFAVAKAMMNQNPDQKIIVISGQDGETIKRRTRLEDMQRAMVLSKPFSFSEFRIAVMDYLNPLAQ
jgi:two-component system OmpR family response regulator